MVLISTFTKAAFLVYSFAGTAQAGIWAQFCNDDNCNNGCGRAVNIENPGCLNQNGRRSVKFHGSTTVFGTKSVVLLGSPKPGCNCQSSCDFIRRSLDLNNVGPIKAGSMAINGCHKLIDMNAKSFRFVGDDCKDNQC